MKGCIEPWGHFVRSTRTSLGLSQKDFALVIGASLHTIQTWEGRILPPGLQNGSFRRQLLGALGSTAEALSDDASIELGGALKAAYGEGGFLLAAWKILDTWRQSLHS